MYVRSAIILCLVSLLLTACNANYEAMAQKRLAFSRLNQGDIHIAAIQENTVSSFINGIQLAAEEINQRPGRLLGRQLHVHIEQGGNDFESNKATIRRITNNPKITAVLGHRSSSVAIPASVIYERSKVIFMPPVSTGEKLTDYFFKYVFRMMPSNTIMAEQITSVAKALGYKKIVVLYARNDFNRELAFLVEDAALQQNIEIINRSSFFEKDKNYRTTIAEFNSSDFDAVFVAASAKASGRMVKQLREMGVDQSVFGSDVMNSEEYLLAAGKSAENTIVPDVLAIDKNNKITRTFIEQYQKKYKTEPDYRAAQGYDSLMLLATAIEMAGSTLPSLLSSTLHYMPAWVGTTGLHAFNEQGELRGKKYFFKAWQSDNWQPLPAIDVPYGLERFQMANARKTDAGAHNNTDFINDFAERLHIDDHKILLLDLAYEILDFKRIGIIYEDTKEGRISAGYELLETLKQRRPIDIVDCVVPFSKLSQEKISQSIIACYGKLSLNIDAMFVPSFHGSDSKLLRQLNRSLTFFKIPSISVDERNTDPNISLRLTRREDVNLRGTGDMQVYGSLLKNLKVHEFAARLKGLPELSVNLINLQRFGKSDDPYLLLSPDHYLGPDTP